MLDRRASDRKRALFRLVGLTLLVTLVGVLPTVSRASTPTAIVTVDFSTTTITELEAADWTFFGTNNMPSITSGGRLRLTTASPGGQAGSAIYGLAQPTSAGLRVQFRQEQLGGSGADGISFFLVEGSTTVDGPGDSGGGLGYMNLPTIPSGGALLGVGLDRFGNFSSCVGFGGDSNQALSVRGGFAEGFSEIAGGCLSGRNWGDPKLVTIEIDPSSAADPKVRVFLDGALRVQVPQPAALRAARASSSGSPPRPAARRTTTTSGTCPSRHSPP